MTAPIDPRIEAVAKLLFTGPLEQMHPDQWERAKAEHWGPAVSCLMAAEEVLRAIDDSAMWEYGILYPDGGEFWPAEFGEQGKRDIYTWFEDGEGKAVIRRRAAGYPEPLPEPPTT
ncbi:hypothetical protein [Rathayibacter sp. Leaf248]|uniref:hypothetical protein n=1 Tax=Rathayibacter sp. Leaf248 TaxID=2876555 RepID=UPI001E4ABDA9|nr:hypothetical protein [Rathayibacter sp. Leaf248]